MKVSVESLDLEHRLAYRFAMLSAQATRCLGDLYREHGLTVVGWRTLSLIGRYEPIYPSSIAERTSVDADKVTRAVDRLVAKRLVVRKVDAEDRRRIVLRLTAHGRRVHAEIDRVRRMIEVEFLSVLAAEELARFYATLGKLEAHASRIFAGKGAWRELLQANGDSRKSATAPSKRGKAKARQ